MERFGVLNKAGDDADLSRGYPGRIGCLCLADLPPARQAVSGSQGRGCARASHTAGPGRRPRHPRVPAPRLLPHAAGARLKRCLAHSLEIQPTFIHPLGRSILPLQMLFPNPRSRHGKCQAEHRGLGARGATQPAALDAFSGRTWTRAVPGGADFSRWTLRGRGATDAPCGGAGSVTDFQAECFFRFGGSPMLG